MNYTSAEKDTEGPKDDKNNKICYNCGKTFRTPADLARHKARKTPCLIRDISPKDRLNPNRCIYCNYVFKQAQGLERHNKVCKIRNGGINILDDKVRHEQKIRVLIEDRDREREQERILNEKKIEEMRAELRAEMRAEMDERLKQLSINNTEVNNINTTNITNNTLNVNNINVTINDYRTPSTDKIKLTIEELVKHHNLPQLFFMSVYMNPRVVENHSIIPRNQKERKVMCYEDGNWRICQGDELDILLEQVSYISRIKGEELITGKNGLIPNCNMDIFNKLPASLRGVFDAGVLKERLSSEVIFGLLFANTGLLSIPNTRIPKITKAE